MLHLLLPGLLVIPATAHEAYMGDCPRYTLMQDFNWTALATGTWYVMEKTSTTSRCLTYTFLTDEDGFKTVRQAQAGGHRGLPPGLRLHRPAGLPRAVLRAGQDDRPVPAQPGRTRELCS